MFDPRPADPNSDAHRSEDGRSEDAARQELPTDGADGQLSLLGLCRHTLSGNASAAAKSAEILLGGVRVYNAAAFAVALTAIEDAFALHRARRSCGSTAALLAVERDHVVHSAGEAVRRMGLLARIARDVGEEAAYPLRVCLERIFENLRRTLFF